jgi:hypothetical protein
MHMEGDRPVDEPNRETVKARQGTGPRIMVSVLLVSLLLAAIAGVVLLLPWLTSPGPGG